jgi:hypothetical protein
MSLYLISYDIAEKDAWEYDALWKKLEWMGAKKILYSEWVVRGTSASNVYNELAPLVQKKDRLLVQGMTNEATWDKLMISDDEFRSMFR